MVSNSVPKGHGGKAVMSFIDKFYEQTPGFTVQKIKFVNVVPILNCLCVLLQDIFDEETFYTFAALFTLVTFIATFLASRYIKIKAKD
jgi:hypothetical protein